MRLADGLCPSSSSSSSGRGFCSLGVFQRSGMLFKYEGKVLVLWPSNRERLDF